MTDDEIKSLEKLCRSARPDEPFRASFIPAQATAILSLIERLKSCESIASLAYKGARNDAALLAEEYFDKWGRG